MNKPASVYNPATRAAGMNSPSRRLALAGVGLLPAIMATVASATTTEDATLHAACGRYWAAKAEVERLNVTPSQIDDLERLNVTPSQIDDLEELLGPASDELRAAVAAVDALAPTTRAGLLAKARVASDFFRFEVMIRPAEPFEAQAEAHEIAAAAILANVIAYLEGEG